MIEKLLENWLDKASELSYQPVFVQMLAAEGYNVLHSTRHCLLEFGKDVLAIGPDGAGCAFQLKGHPGGRMRIAEFRRDIQEQLIQLMGQSPSYPGFPSGTHRSYLVSNGQFEEEVQTAVREMNLSPYPSKVDLWSRGHLLAMCKQHAEILWPGELNDSRVLLEIYMLNPKGQLPVQMLGAVLSSVLGLGENVEPFGRAEFVRASSSAAWLTGIAIASFAEAKNYQAVALAWTLCSVSLIGASEKHAAGDVSSIESSLSLAKVAALDALAALWEEVRTRDHLVEGDPLTDLDIYGWRISVLYGLLTSLAIAADKDSSLLDLDSKKALHHWLIHGGHRPQLWGEAAVANIVPWTIWLRKNLAGKRPDDEILALTTVLVRVNLPPDAAELPSPYYDAEAALTMSIPWLKQTRGLAEQREVFRSSMYTAELVFHLLVRTNLKQSCKSLWSDFTRLNHRRIELRSKSDYCSFRVTGGFDESKIYQPTYEWAQLKKDALEGNGSTVVPKKLAECPWLLSMWWQVAPQRMNSEAVRVLAEALLPGWGG